LTLKKLALSAPLRLAWTVLLYLGVNGFLDKLDIARAGHPPGSYLWIVRNAVVALAVLWFSVRLEGQGLEAAGLSLRGAPVSLALGFLAGAAIISAVVGVLGAAGAYRIDGLAPLAPGTSRVGLFALAFGALLLVGFREEVRDRGILFRLLEQSLGTWAAIGLSALAFGFSHWTNTGATPWSSLAIALEGGVLLAALYAATRSLWLPIGVHWGWNLFEGPIWGAAVSGHSVEVWLKGTIRGPSWLTGGIFGPEAGIPALVVGGTAGILAMAWMVRRGEVRRGPWARARTSVPGPELGSAPATPAPARTGNDLPGS